MLRLKRLFENAAWLHDECLFTMSVVNSSFFTMSIAEFFFFTMSIAGFFFFHFRRPIKTSQDRLVGA